MIKPPSQRVTLLCALLLCTMLSATAGGASEVRAGSAAGGPEEPRAKTEAEGHAAAGAPPAGEKAAAPEAERQFFGPLFAKGETAAGGAAGAAGAGEHYTVLRPLWLRQEATDESGELRYTEHTFLYPLFSYRRSAQRLDWSLLNLVNFSRGQHPAQSGAAAPHAAPDSHGGERSFDVWPIYLSRDTGDPATSYRAVFPIAGHIQSRFGYDSLQWLLFPLTLRSEKAGRVTHSVAWPIFKKRSGDGHRGLAVWPLFGFAEKQGEYRTQYALWPLVYNNTRYDPASGAPTRHALGVLPFYAREERPGSISESYLWPFFGYTLQAAPLPTYRESRYLWPLLVQGRGAEHYVNRWAPFYTHSVRRGVDKRWLLWPLFRHEEWAGQGLLHTKNQVLFFLYASEQQRSAAQPDLPAAHKTHLWPLLSTWDNGAGHAQVQLLSPLSVFFPNNEKIRLIYNPLFALYRYDQRKPGQARHEWLWRAVTWERRGEARELRVFGPLLGWRKNAQTRKWRLFLFDFSHKPDKVAATPKPDATPPAPAPDGLAPAAQVAPQSATGSRRASSPQRNPR
ncbi:hypothetical protein AXK11_00965 [Cephaloticoccus primus]|uniref:Uncharacterized protein n=1 Tax=Cephaloticoccus primus TaxID=1548207 RepID=A0A139SUD1_9BACT|nr:hypothetical protein [Cephaloticoccus primus]KXU38199.1 hypothetical protein AXK11_00965 [Cephaloticoccus primus]